MNREKLARKREQLVAQLPDLTQTVRGSLLQRTIRHRQGCPKCARGEGHPVSVLTISYPGGKNKQISLKSEQLPQVKRWIANYRQLKANLEAISELNHQLLRLDRDK